MKDDFVFLKHILDSIEAIEKFSPQMDKWIKPLS